MNKMLGNRNKYIGASDIAAILGISPWVTPYKCWLYKTGKEEPVENEYMQRGKNLEPQAREIYIEQTGNQILGESEFIYKDWPIAIAHPDGVDLDGNIIVEIKCPNKSSSVDLYNIDGIPEHYYVQVQWQLMCSGAKECHFFVYHPGTEPYLEIVKPDKQYFITLLDEAKDFWKLVESVIPPATTDKDYIKIEDPEFEQYANEYIKILEEEKSVFERKKMLGEKIKGCTDGGNCYGFGLKVFNVSGRKIVDWKSVQKEYNLDDDKLKPFVKYGASYQVIKKTD